MRTAHSSAARHCSTFIFYSTIQCERAHKLQGTAVHSVVTRTWLSRHSIVVLQSYQLIAICSYSSHWRGYGHHLVLVLYCCSRLVRLWSATHRPLHKYCTLLQQVVYRLFCTADQISWFQTFTVLWLTITFTIALKLRSPPNSFLPSRCFFSIGFKCRIPHCTLSI